MITLLKYWAMASSIINSCTRCWTRSMWNAVNFSFRKCLNSTHERQIFHEVGNFSFKGFEKQFVNKDFYQNRSKSQKNVSKLWLFSIFQPVFALLCISGNAHMFSDLNGVEWKSFREKNSHFLFRLSSLFLLVFSCPCVRLTHLSRTALERREGGTASNKGPIRTPEISWWLLSSLV